MNKIVIAILFLSLSFAPVADKDLQTSIPYEIELAKAHDYIYREQPGKAYTLAKYYVSISDKYNIPLLILLRQGYVESRYDSKRVGDSGKSFGIHQIKEGYFGDTIRILGGDATSRKSRIAWLQVDTNGIEAAAYILNRYFMEYGTWETALLAYGCGRSHRSTKRSISDKKHAYKYRFVREILR